ncbi:hypothetical protein HY622_04435 [Candidatus Uhrbacteria bacterium]|nr:hypothetical protein [Candidatus Uhrbacteria bacterium]
MNNYRIKTIDKIDQNGLRFLGMAEVGNTMKDPDALIVRSTKVDISQYPSVFAIARAGIGVDNIPVEQATRRGICVFNAPGSNSNAVAELVFAVLFSYARHTARSTAYVRSLLVANDEELTAQIEQGKNQFTGFELRGKTLGVVGLGNIGVLVANIGASLGMRVIGFDPHATPRNMHRLRLDVEIVDSLNELLRESDVITVHIPLLESTRGLIGTVELNEVKHACILLNYSRQGIYDDDAVLAALDAGTVAAYLTDFPTVKLLRHNQVILTPHLGSGTRDSQEKCAEMACRQLAHYITYGIIENSVNFPPMTQRPEKDIQSRLVVVNANVPRVIHGYTAALEGFNIEAQVNLRSFDKTVAYNILDFSGIPSAATVQRVKDVEGVLHARLLQF